MRVIEVIRSMNQGGAQQLLVNRVQSELARGHQTLIFNTLAREDQLAGSVAGEHVALQSAASDSVLAAHGELRSLASDFQPDVVVVHSPAPAVPLKVERMLGRFTFPVVEVIHNTRYQRRIVEYASALTNRGSDATLVVSEAAARSRAARGARRTQVMHQGVPVSEMRAWMESHRAELDGIRGEARAGAGDTLFVYCGRLVPEKRVLDLIGGMSEARASGARLLVVGDGPQLGEAQAAVESLGLGDVVTIVGRRPGGWHYIAAGDVFCLLSEHEGLPVSIMEALAVGRPVLGTRIPEFRDVLSDGGNAVLVDVGDVAAIGRAIRELTADRETRLRLTEGAGNSGWEWDAARSDALFYGTLSAVGSTRSQNPRR